MLPDIVRIASVNRKAERLLGSSKTEIAQEEAAADAMATKTATIARPATGETLRGKQKEKDVRMSNIIAAKGALP